MAKSIFILFLISILPFANAQDVTAEFPLTYQLGLSQAEVTELTRYWEFWGEFDVNGNPLGGYKVDETGINCVADYRKMPYYPRTNKEEKPTAQFAVIVNGEQRIVSDATEFLDAPTKVLDVNIDDTIEIVDLSKPYGSNHLDLWDFQYRVMPTADGVDLNNIQDYRSQFTIVPKYLRSSQDVNNHFQNVIWKEVKETSAKYPGKGVYVELYLQVQDKNSKDGSTAGGENGTYATIKTKEEGSIFPKGNTWYFTTVLLRVNTKGTPDFFPLPDGAKEWKESYKTCAASYSYDENDTNVNFNVQLGNLGVKDTTDFVAYFKNDPKNIIWESNPKSVTLDRDERKEFNLTVPIADNTKTYEVEFKANTDGKTPEAEKFLENNVMVIKIAPKEIKNKAGLELTQKRITKAYDLNDIGGVKTFNFSYPSAGYHVWYCGSEDCSGHTCYRTTPVDDKYNYLVNHSNALNPLLLGTVDPFAPNYNGTDTTLGSGKKGIANWDGGTDTLDPNMSYVVWRGKDKPTLASYKVAADHPLTKLGLSRDKIPQNARNTAGGYKDNFTVLLRQNTKGDYQTTFTCGHGNSSTQTHTTNNSTDYDADVNIYTFIGSENIGNITVDGNANKDFKVKNGSTYGTGATGLKSEASGIPIRSEGRKIEFYPYVQMAYDEPYNNSNPKSTTAVNVLAQHKSTIIPVDFVNVGWVRDNAPTLNIKSKQWSSHAKVKQFLGGKYKKDNALPGGVQFELDTSGPKTKAAVTTWQHFIPADQINNVVSDTSYFNLSQANQRHNNLKEQVKGSLDTLDVEQYVNSNVNVSNAFGGARVKGHGKSITIAGRTFNLSNELKHHFLYGTNKSSKKINEADMDIFSEKNSQTIYMVKSDVNGNVYVHKDGAQIAELDKTQDASILTGEAKELDDKTKLVTNFINALDRNKGNDTTVGNGPEWYNEAWDGLCVVKIDTEFEIGLKEPSRRSCVLDPKLTPPQASQREVYSTAYSSQFRLNTRSYSQGSDGKVGVLSGEDIIMPSMEDMYQSKLFYIPSGTVKDNIMAL